MLMMIQYVPQTAADQLHANYPSWLSRSEWVVVAGPRTATTKGVPP